MDKCQISQIENEPKNKPKKKKTQKKQGTIQFPVKYHRVLK